MKYSLTTSAEIGGKEYDIRSDYRAILDILEVFNDVELDNEQKVLTALAIFYPEFLEVPNEFLNEAVNQMMDFINCGDDGDNRKRPKLMDWEQDFQYIVAPINRVIGKEIRSLEYLHWWTFISAYYEIGDCLFAQIVRIRSLKAKGKRLDKQDQEFYKENKRLVDIKSKYSETEEKLLQQWI